MREQTWLIVYDKLICNHITSCFESRGWRRSRLHWILFHTMSTKPQYSAQHSELRQQWSGQSRLMELQLKALRILIIKSVVYLQSCALYQQHNVLCYTICTYTNNSVWLCINHVLSTWPYGLIAFTICKCKTTIHVRGYCNILKPWIKLHKKYNYETQFQISIKI